MNALAATPHFTQPIRTCVADFHRIRDALALAFAGTALHDITNDPCDIDALPATSSNHDRPFVVRVKDRQRLGGFALETAFTLYRDDAKNKLTCETSVRLTQALLDPARSPVALVALIRRLSVQGTRWSSPTDVPAWNLLVYDAGCAAGFMGHDRLAELVPEPHGLPVATRAALVDKIRRRLSNSDRRWLTDHEADLSARTMAQALKFLATY